NVTPAKAGVQSPRWILTAGLGGMGGAQPLAATMAGMSMLAIECRQSRIDMRLRTRYLDKQAASLDEALAMLRGTKTPISIGLLGNAADIVPENVKRGVRPDLVTDQTSAHDLVNGYLPSGWTVEQWEAAQKSNPKSIEVAARESIKRHVAAMLELH